VGADVALKEEYRTVLTRLLTDGGVSNCLWPRSTLRRTSSTYSAGIVSTRFLPPSM
jgi:hypothetical protein